jgi:hypothetical protein
MGSLDKRVAEATGGAERGEEERERARAPASYERGSGGRRASAMVGEVVRGMIR